MYLKIAYPVEREGPAGMKVVEMVISIRPEPDFRGENDGGLLKDMVRRWKPEDTVQVVLFDSSGKEKFRLSSSKTSLSTDWGTLTL